jgi:hypothetical protein
MDQPKRLYKCLEPGCDKVQGFKYAGGLSCHRREVHKKKIPTRAPLHNAQPQPIGNLVHYIKKRFTQWSRDSHPPATIASKPDIRPPQTDLSTRIHLSEMPPELLRYYSRQGDAIIVHEQPMKLIAERAHLVEGQIMSARIGVALDYESQSILRDYDAQYDALQHGLARAEEENSRHRTVIAEKDRVLLLLGHFEDWQILSRPADDSLVLDSPRPFTRTSSWSCFMNNAKQLYYETTWWRRGRRSYCSTSLSWLCESVGSLVLKHTNLLRSLMQQMGTGTGLVAVFCALPRACAAPTIVVGSASNLDPSVGWLHDFSLSQFLAWTIAIFVASLATYVGRRGPSKDPAHYTVLSLGASVASLVFLDAGAASWVRWPTLTVGSIFLVEFWRKLSQHNAMGLGWLPVVLGVGLLLDAILVNLTTGTQGGNQGLFPQLLLTCLWLSLSACSSVAWVVKRLKRIDLRRVWDSVVEE